MTSLSLSVIIPCGPADGERLDEFLASLKRQTLPQDSYEVLVIREGNSEEAKAIGIHRAQGEILGLFCTDNIIRDPHFLSSMLWYTRQKDVCGAYTAQYDHVKWDKPLSRYFALLGANDPLCWWLGKADRQDYLNGKPSYVHKATFPEAIPSIGDNGFFIKRDIMLRANPCPETHFCIDAIEDLRKLGYFTYNIVPTLKVWHKTGESLWVYLGKRYRYTRDLYWRDLGKRRWVMVERKDWLRVILFALASVVVVPHLLTALKGYRQVKDTAWFLHPLVCILMTGLYAYLFLRHRMPQLLSRLWKGHLPSGGALNPSLDSP